MIANYYRVYPGTPVARVSSDAVQTSGKAALRMLRIAPCGVVPVLSRRSRAEAQGDGGVQRHVPLKRRPTTIVSPDGTDSDQY